MREFSTWGKIAKNSLAHLTGEEIARMSARDMTNANLTPRLHLLIDVLKRHKPQRDAQIARAEDFKKLQKKINRDSLWRRGPDWFIEGRMIEPRGTDAFQPGGSAHPRFPISGPRSIKSQGPVLG